MDKNSIPKQPVGKTLDQGLPTLNMIADTAVTKIMKQQLALSSMPDPQSIERAVIDQMMLESRTVLPALDKDARWKVPAKLLPSQIADILLNLYHIVLIAGADETGSGEYDLLGIYVEDNLINARGFSKESLILPFKYLEDRYGTYATDEIIFKMLAKTFNKSARSGDVEEVINALRERAPRKKRSSDMDLIAVNNGIFNYRTKELSDFSPDCIFLAKSNTDYVENPKNPIIKHPEDKTLWDIESWIEELSDGDEEMDHLLWQILGAVLRPFVPWGKAAWFYAEKGNNGKGSLCELMRNLVGRRVVASISLKAFSEQFSLGPLINAQAIIVDENPVGVYIDQSDALKAVVTNDVVQIERKYQNPIPYRFFGFMIQCVNEKPRVKDKSDSFYRRQLFVPFTKSFTGRERRYIKRDYLGRKEVLEYALWKVLNMNYYELSEPTATKETLAEYKEYNDPVRVFANEVITELSWDFLPNDFLYDLYKEWFKKGFPSGGLQSKTTFLDDLRQVIPEGWIDKTGRNHKVKVTGKFTKPEPYLERYDLKEWMNPRYRSEQGNEKRLIPDELFLPQTMRGLLRA